MEIAGRAALVVGLARSGMAASRLLRRLGARVTATDAKPAASLQVEIAELAALGIPVIAGEHPPRLLEKCDLIVKNPGIPYRIDLLEEASRRGIPIVTEIEIAGLVARAPILGITGSNGKTTTTTLTFEMLRQSGIKALAGGNIGTPLADVAQDAGADTWLVTELSSFQLAGIRTFRPRIATVLNVYPAHLDYHGTMAEYTAAKARIFANQSEEDIAVVNVDHAATLSMRPAMRAQVREISAHDPVADGVYAAHGALFVARQKESRKLVDVGELALRGAHNVENAVAAAALALAAGARTDAVADVLRTFAGVEHRLEFVRELAGVRYVNDSKATNPTAAVQALRVFREPLVVILGGLERGDDLSPLVEPLRAHVRAVVTLGESAARMEEVARQAGVRTILSAAALPEAVLAAHGIAQPGDVVLLSPAAASWDMFPSFEARGRMFKEAVHTL